MQTILRKLYLMVLALLVTGMAGGGKPLWAADDSEVEDATEVAKEAASAGADAAKDQLGIMAHFFTPDRLSLYLLNGIRILVLLVIVGLIWRVGGFLIRRLLRNKQRAASAAGGVQLSTAGHLIESVFNYFMLFIALVGVLGIIGVDIRGMVAGAGIAGVLIAFVSQSIIKDWVSGLFTLIERHYDVGDWVKLADFEGEVLSVGMRSTTIRTAYGETVFIPNGMVDAVVNYSKYPSVVLFDIPLPYECDNLTARQALTEACDRFNNEAEPGEDLYSPAALLGVNAFEASAVMWRISFTSTYLAHWVHTRQLRAILKEILDDRGIGIPYDQLVIHQEPAEPPEESSPDAVD